MEAEFLPATLAIQAQPASVTLRATAWVLMTLIIAALVWACVGEIDIVANASGRVIPSGRTKSIASVDVASVRALHVEEGRRVRAGDLLIELDSSGPDAERDKASGDRAMAELQVERSRALLSAIEENKPLEVRRPAQVSEAQWAMASSHAEAQYRDYRARLERIDAEIARYAEALPLVERRASDFRRLAAVHDVSEHAWLEKEQARVELQGQLEDARKQRSAHVAQVLKEARDSLAEGARVAASSTQDARRAGAHGRLLQLRSPIDGTVQQLKAHTVGGIVPAAETLMLIVPTSDRIEVEAILDNRDVGFVQPGQRAAVKLDAFDYTRFGVVPGQVVQVSADSLEDRNRGLVYTVKVLLDQKAVRVQDRELPIGTGMSVNVEIKTGERRVIEYLLSPLLQHRREALRER